MSHLNVSNIMSLHGQVALVTGGGTGIGFMIAKGFAANGAKVYITGRREEVLRKAAASLSAKEGVLIPIVMDVTDQTSIDNAVKHLEAAEGRLDILVNNAGIGAPTSQTDPDFLQKKMDNYVGKKDPLEHETFQGWADVFRTNISASFFVVRSFLDLLVKGAQARQSTACVINVGSVAAFIRSWLTVASFAYSVSKSALDKLSIGLATDFAHRGIPIRVNVLHPGMFPSEMAPPATEENIAAALPGLIAPVPVQRTGTEEEMVMTAMYLAACTYTNGASVAVDGGITLVNP
ncbi:NAD(P)-binding protein [Hymenopellis radicata]|nr:NAD(P)-binding protein [Hymenopellis radicata]